jgi:hypothetical protein
LRFFPFHVPPLLFHAFSFFGFSALAYIYPCTLHCSKKRIRYHSPSLRTLLALAFYLHSTCLRTLAHPRNLPSSPHSFLEPDSHPSCTLTCILRAPLFCFVLGMASAV